MPGDCFLFGLAPGGVYLANLVAQAAGELLPHRFTLTARRTQGPSRGGLLSVALSRTLRSVGVTHRPVLRSPDFPPAEKISAGGHPVRSELFRPQAIGGRHHHNTSQCAS